MDLQFKFRVKPKTRNKNYMALNRRNFLRTTLAGAAVAAGSSAFAACGGKAASTEGCPTERDHAPTAKAELKISFQEGIAPGANLNEKLDYIGKVGRRWFRTGWTRPERSCKRDQGCTQRTQYQSERHLCRFQGFILSTDPAIRKQCMDTMKRSWLPQAN